MFACFGFAGESSHTALKPSPSTQATTKWYKRSWKSKKARAAAKAARAAGLPQPVGEGVIGACAGDPAATHLQDPHQPMAIRGSLEHNQLSERQLKKARRAEKARERLEEKAAFQANM